MLEAELGDGLADARGLVGIERIRKTRLHIAEGAGARAGVAHDHHGGVAVGPAFADVRAAGFLADRVQPVLADDLLRGRKFAADGRLHADPFGLALDGRIGPMRLFRVARGPEVVAVLVENDGHSPYIEAVDPKITKFRRAFTSMSGGLICPKAKSRAPRPSDGSPR